MNKRAPLILFITILATIGGVGLVFWRSIRDAIIAPLSEFIMMIADFISMFDQVYLWGAVLFILIIVTVTRLGKSKTTVPQSRIYRLKTNTVGRLRFWETQVFLLTQGRVPSRYSIHEVRKLLVSVMGYKLHLDAAETDQRLKSGDLKLPPEYDTFAEYDQEPDEQEDLLTIVANAVVSILRRKRERTIQAREKVLNELIKVMEKQLEIEHDH